ncbi:MAG: DNA/RNA nuclease SfsA [Candidatus Thermoplasmatota archaeon]|jgi:sugar fermentation stimulation protein A|nr:DNA/RNA nuclease SfsA [Candidatus Thermoplasmatota archaeon]
MNREILKIPDTGTVAFTVNDKLTEASVLDRPNRFLVRAVLKGVETLVHLHDPGRIRELIYPGNRILVRETDGRKTSYSVTAARSHGEWILLDSRFHNKIAAAFLPEGCMREVSVENARLDFACGDCLIEIKGSTLCIDRVARFPDAPSERASRHARILGNIASHGGRALMVFLVFSPAAESFAPNSLTDPTFAAELSEAVRKGVELRALKFEFADGKVKFMNEIPCVPDWGKEFHK